MDPAELISAAGSQEYGEELIAIYLRIRTGRQSRQKQTSSGRTTRRRRS
jgi:hypothetical protein